MPRALLPTVLLTLAGVSGCFKGSFAIPEIPYAEPRASAPPAAVAQAAVGDKADLVRENDQLRARQLYLQDDNARLARKYESLGNDLRKIQADIDKAAVQRDRYKQAAGR